MTIGGTNARRGMPLPVICLLTACLSALASFAAHGWDPPNIWWPADRAWCVATDIDLNSTFVACSRPCAGALIAERALEVIETSRDATTYFTADTINLD